MSAKRKGAQCVITLPIPRWSFSQKEEPVAELNNSAAGFLLSVWIGMIGLLRHMSGACFHAQSFQTKANRKNSVRVAAFGLRESFIIGLIADEKEKRKWAIYMVTSA